MRLGLSSWSTFYGIIATGKFLLFLGNFGYGFTVEFAGVWLLSLVSLNRSGKSCEVVSHTYATQNRLRSGSWAALDRSVLTSNHLLSFSDIV